MNPPIHMRLSVVFIILSLVPGVSWFVVRRIIPMSIDRDFVFAAVVAVAVLAFWSWIARNTWMGRRWARTAQTVLVPIGIAGVLIGASNGRYGLDWTDPIVGFLSIAAVVYLWTPSSREYIAAVTAATRAPKPVKPYLDPALRRPRRLDP